MTFNQLCNKLDGIDDIDVICIAPDGKSANIGYGSFEIIPHWMIVLYDNGHISWNDAPKVYFPDKAWDLIDKYRTQVRYGEACNDYRSKGADERITFNELLNKISSLGLKYCKDTDIHGDQFIRLGIGFGPAIIVRPNHSINYVGSKREFWNDIADSSQLHIIINEFIKGDNHMTKKEINERISEDIQQLAKDLTKKKEIEHSTKMSKKIADDLGVRLPKSKDSKD